MYSAPILQYICNLTARQEEFHATLVYGVAVYIKWKNLRKVMCNTYDFQV